MINYNKIASSVDYYTYHGYKYIDVPWIVSRESIDITKPEDVRLFTTFAGDLVASGEQSFLHIRNELRIGKYQCVTPCFRDEKNIDESHKQYFIKNELIWVVNDDDDKKLVIDMMIDDAFNFFRRYSQPEIVDVPIDNAQFNKDIYINGIEVGSYGYRFYEDFHWIYGTGCAEPRLTFAEGFNNVD